MKKVLASLLIGVVSIGLFGCLNDSKVIDMISNVETMRETQNDNIIKEGQVDEKPRVLPEDVPYRIIGLESDSTGTIWGNMVYENTSRYPIIEFSLEILDNNTNEKFHYSCYDTVMPEEISPIMKSLASKNMTVSKIEYTIYDKESKLFCYYKYNVKLEKLGWSAWYKNY